MKVVFIKANMNSIFDMFPISLALQYSGKIGLAQEGSVSKSVYECNIYVVLPVGLALQ